MRNIKNNYTACSPFRYCQFFTVCLFILSTIILAPLPCNAFSRNTWSSSELKLRFTYDNTKWSEVSTIQDSTAVTINWLSKKSGGLLASCYIGAFDSGFGLLGPSDVHGQFQNVAESIKKNELKRAVEYRQIALEKKYTDNHPVIYLSRSVKTRSFDGDEVLNVYSIITAWNNKEIIFSCASAIPGRFPQYKEEIEKNMISVLKTLQFDR